MSEDEVPAGTLAGTGGNPPDVWSAPQWTSPPSPPGWWPQSFYTYEPPPPPRRTSRLRIVAVAGLLVILGASAAATAVIATRGMHASGSASGVVAAIVDIDTTLGGSDAAAGTGMVLTSTGEVLTNNHVIDGALSINVVVPATGATYPATVVGYSRAQDVAVLQLSGASGLATMPIGDSSSVRVGDSVTAMGNALGRGGTPASASGNVTALDQSITASDQSGGDVESLDGMIQIDAAIQPGDSGGPLVNDAEHVIGMDTAASGGYRARQNGAVEGFAIPINSALSVAHQIASGSGSQNNQAGQGAMLGVCAEDSSSRAGAVIATGCASAPDGIAPGSPASTTGLVAGDVITGLGGAPVDSRAGLESLLLQHRAGDNVVIVWFTPSGHQEQATVTLVAAPPGPPQ